MKNSVQAALTSTQSRLAAAAQQASRNAAEITLIAVSKTFSANEITPALDAGQRVFGENRVQEAQAKWPELRKAYGPLELHLIGPLQSNKAAEAVALFDCIQTVDRPKIASALAKEIAKQRKHVKLLVQVNTGDEAQKAGVKLNEADAFIVQCKAEFGLTISGLMCIPPLAEQPQKHFQILAALAKKHQLQQLSMGMSSDFEIAINCGATIVRLGSAIFGQR
jgi:PLP dependent protein